LSQLKQSKVGAVDGPKERPAEGTGTLDTRENLLPLREESLRVKCSGDKDVRRAPLQEREDLDLKVTCLVSAGGETVYGRGKELRNKQRCSAADPKPPTKPRLSSVQKSKGESMREQRKGKRKRAFHR